MRTRLRTALLFFGYGTIRCQEAADTTTRSTVDQQLARLRYIQLISKPNRSLGLDQIHSNAPRRKCQQSPVATDVAPAQLSTIRLFDARPDDEPGFHPERSFQGRSSFSIAALISCRSSDGWVECAFFDAIVFFSLIFFFVVLAFILSLFSMNISNTICWFNDLLQNEALHAQNEPISGYKQNFKHFINKLLLF